MFQVLKKTPFSPYMMGGDGEIMNTFGNYPYTPMPAFTKIYYMLSLSYYIEDGLTHLVQTPKYDYWEMVLHHVVAAMLIFSSYMNGFWTIGIFVLVQMDIEDVFVGIVRSIMDYAPHWQLFIVYFCIMASWFYFRFVAYTTCVLYTFGLGARLSVDNFTEVVTVIDILLITLLALNVYWFILLGVMGYKLAFKKQATDLQAYIKLKSEKKNK